MVITVLKQRWTRLCSKCYFTLTLLTMSTACLFNYNCFFRIGDGYCTPVCTLSRLNCRQTIPLNLYFFLSSGPPTVVHSFDRSRGRLSHGVQVLITEIFSTVYRNFPSTSFLSGFPVRRYRVMIAPCLIFRYMKK